MGGHHLWLMATCVNLWNGLLPAQDLLKGFQTFILIYALVTCKPGDRGDIVGLKGHAFDSIPKTAAVISHLPVRILAGLSIKMSPHCVAYIQALQREKSKSLLFPGPTGAVVTNDWCIIHIKTLEKVGNRKIGKWLKTFFYSDSMVSENNN